MTASENTAEGPALPNTSITTTRRRGSSGTGKANRSMRSAVGSVSARGPEKWSDIAHLFFDWSEARRKHQTVVLVDQEVGLFGELEIPPPFRIGRHCRAFACAVGRVLEHPQVHERVDVPALRVQVGERGTEMPYLRSETMLAIQVKLLRHLVRPDAISAEIDDHG